VRRIRVPGDKSITHRALILGALGGGRSLIQGPLVAADTRATAAALRALGVGVGRLEDEVVPVDGVGLRGLRPPAGVIDCANSGTTSRLLLGVLAAQPLTATLTGDPSLRSRPMRRVTEPLSRMGARFRELERPDRLPIEVSGGALSPIEHASRHASAQVKSAILLAALCAGVDARVREPLPSRDHTERMLLGRGIAVRWSLAPDGGRDILLPATTALDAQDVEVPGDFSAAAFLLAAALLLEREVVVERVGVNPTRTGMLQVLARMGAPVSMEGTVERGGEPVADLYVRPAILSGALIGGDEVPALIDELPVLAALAARAEGVTEIRGAGELRVKESDRIALMVENLRGVGGDAEEREDGMIVRGTRRALAGEVRTGGDHRIAMAFGVLAALPGNEIRIDDPTCAAVSFPGFWDELARLAGSA
jgi:3-phosphoshikimate 1-carboxyvinyltransferase